MSGLFHSVVCAELFFDAADSPALARPVRSCGFKARPQPQTKWRKLIKLILGVVVLIALLSLSAHGAITVTASGTTTATYTAPGSSFYPGPYTNQGCLTSPYTGTGASTGSTSTGTLTYSFSSPVSSVRVPYTYFNQFRGDANFVPSHDGATLSTNTGGTLTLSNPCGVTISGNQIIGGPGGAFDYGDVWITVTSTVPFTQLIATNNAGAMASGFNQGALADVVIFSAATTTLTIAKTSQGGTGSFVFTGDNGFGSQTITTITAGTAQSGATRNLATPGAITTISETSPGTFALASVSCSGMGAGGTVSVNRLAGTFSLDAAATVAGRNIVCAVTNNRRPSLRVTKISNGSTGSFVFTGNNGWASTTVTTTVAGAGFASAWQTLALPNAVTTITETAPGFRIASVSCPGISAPTINATRDAFTIPAASLAAGLSLDCTVTNTKVPRLTLTTTSNLGTGAFVFTGNNGWSSQTITTTAPGLPVTGATQNLAAAGVVTVITQTLPANYVMTAASCTGLGTGTATVNLTARTITLNAAATAAANNISCSITNTKQTTLTLVKNLVNTGGGTAVPTAWTLSATGPASISGVTGAPAVTNVVVPVGTYALSESVGPSGYMASLFACSINGGAAVPGNSVTIAAGNTVVCTITNTFAAPALSLDKSWAFASPGHDANGNGLADVGDIITYYYDVTNTGNVVITGVSVSDLHGGAGVLGSITPASVASLAPSASAQFTATYTVVQGDIDNQ